MSDGYVADEVMKRYAISLRELADNIEAGKVAGVGPEAMLCMTLDNIVRKCSDCSYRFTCIKSAVFGVIGGVGEAEQDKMFGLLMKMMRLYTDLDAETRYGLLRSMLEFWGVSCVEVESIMGGVFKDCVEYGPEEYWVELDVVPSAVCGVEWSDTANRNEQCLLFVPGGGCLSRVACVNQKQGVCKKDGDE